jgi:hypothetical protein
MRRKAVYRLQVLLDGRVAAKRFTGQSGVRFQATDPIGMIGSLGCRPVRGQLSFRMYPCPSRDDFYSLDDSRLTCMSGRSRLHLAPDAICEVPPNEYHGDGRGLWSAAETNACPCPRFRRFRSLKGTRIFSRTGTGRGYRRGGAGVWEWLVRGTSRASSLPEDNGALERARTMPSQAPPIRALLLCTVWCAPASSGKTKNESPKVRATGQGIPIRERGRGSYATTQAGQVTKCSDSVGSSPSSRPKYCPRGTVNAGDNSS